MMSIMRSTLSPNLATNVSRRFGTNLSVVNNKSVLAGLRAAPGKKILYFNNNWHVMCKTMDPVFFNLTTTYPDIRFIAINLEMFTAEAAELGVVMVPTFKFVADREVVCTLITCDEPRFKNTVKTFAQHEGTAKFEPAVQH